MVGVRRRVRKPCIEDDDFRPALACLDNALGVRVEVMPGLEVTGDEEYDVRVFEVRAGAVGPYPQVEADPGPGRADVRVGVAAIHTPRGQHLVGEPRLTRTSHMVHDLIGTPGLERGPNAPGELIQRLIPTHPLPFSLTAASGALQGIQYPIRIRDLVQRGRTLGVVPPT